jgi:hypothetical protein
MLSCKKKGYNVLMNPETARKIFYLILNASFCVGSGMINFSDTGKNSGSARLLVPKVSMQP